MDNSNEVRKKTVAGIVLYNPELNHLQENIEHIITQVDLVVMFDNGSNNITAIEKLSSEWLEKIVLLKSNENIGIAAALNHLCRWGENHGYQYIITLDQDSACSIGIIDTLQQNLRADVAVVAPNIIYRNNEAFAVRRNDVVKAEWVITSGSLISLKIWEELGGFDEKLFIDGVDRDFCTRARKQGYHILKDYNVELLHELGNLKCRKIFGKTIYVTNHQAFRKYYMVRNVIYLDKKLGETKRYRYVMKHIFKTILFENEKLKKLHAIYKGICDGRLLKKEVTEV
jgi:rhamnosyltransferase